MQISLRKWVHVGPRSHCGLCRRVSGRPEAFRRRVAHGHKSASCTFKLVKKKTFNFSCTARQEARRLFRATPRRPGAPHTHGHGPPAAGNAAPGRRAARPRCGSPRAPCGCRLCPGNGSRTTLGIRAYAIVECSAEATTAHWAARALCAAACVPRGLSLLSRCGRPLFARGCTPRRRESDLRGVERESHRQSAPVTRRGRRLGRHAPTSRRLRYQLSKWSSSVLSDVNCHWFRSSGAPAARAGGDAASAHLAGAPQRSMAAA